MKGIFLPQIFTDKRRSTKRIFPIYGFMGLGLIVLFWGLNWGLSGLRSHWGFFPLWLGYILTIDAMVYMRKGTSLFTRDISKFIMLFVISIPCWWLFEAINQITLNWIYQGREYFTDLQFAMYASINFSTVIPAIFVTGELAGTFNWIKKIKKGFIIKSNPKNYIIIFIIGILMFILIYLFPQYFFPLVWISLYFIIDPVNHFFGNKTLLYKLNEGNWNSYIALAVGALICGFFWEMWNFYSFPKWTYYLPIANFGHVFEMPVLGYTGYIPFSWEIFALYYFINGLIFRNRMTDYPGVG